MQSIFRIPSDDMVGDAKRRVPIHYYTRRNRMDLLILIIIIIIAVSHNRELDIPGRLKKFFEKARSEERRVGKECRVRGR